jgi:hypothetical protein
MTFNKWPFLLAGVISLAGLTFASAQSAATPSATTKPAMPPPMLDNDEMAQLKKARMQVLEANPDLKTEEEKLKALHESTQNQNPPPTPEQRNATFAEWKAYQSKMRAEMLKIDPTLKPVFAKLDEARKHGAPAPFQPAPAK